jgi:hypothetical protein
MRIEEITGTRVLFIDEDGPLIASTEEASDLIGGAWSAHVGLLVVPTERLDPRFFQPESLFAGDVLQKAASYDLTIAILGDISGPVAANPALRDFVTESNQGDHVWFVEDEPAVENKLAAGHPPRT